MTTNNYRLFGLSVIFIFGSLFFPGISYAADFVVDFSKTTVPIKHSGSGFEFGLGSSVPADSVVKPLKPRTIRDFNSSMTRPLYDRVVSLGAIPNVALTDGSCSISPWPGDGGPYGPFADRWVACVSDRVASAKNAGMSAKEWEIWAEPDLPPANAPGYWPNSPYPTADFLDLWDRSFRAVKSADPSAKVVGPSTFQYSSSYMDQFLDHCKAAATCPDVISWHELYDVFSSANNFVPSDVTGHAVDFRRKLINKALPDRKIEITEYIGYVDDYRPGVAVQFLSNLEISNLYGTKGNWVSGHTNNLNELISSSQSTTVRSIWWAYKYYADMTGLLATRTLAGAVDGLATIDQNKQEARILVGNIGSLGAKTVTVTGLPNYLLDSNGSVNVLVERIPNSETSDLASPTVISYGLTRSSGGNIDINLPDFPKWGAYSIVLAKPGELLTGAAINFKQINVSFNNPMAQKSDWIGLYTPGSLIGNFIDWKWLDNTGTSVQPADPVTIGNVTFSVPSPGSYEVRYVRWGFALDTRTVGTPAPTGISKTGDVNADNAVNILDIGIIVDNYGQNPAGSNPKADLNSDGAINIIDIGIVIDNYGR